MQKVDRSLRKIGGVMENFGLNYPWRLLCGCQNAVFLVRQCLFKPCELTDAPNKERKPGCPQVTYR